MRISDWSSDVCSSDLDDLGRFGHADAGGLVGAGGDDAGVERVDEVGRFRRRAGGDLEDGLQPVLAVAGVDPLGAVAGEEVLVEHQARLGLEDRSEEHTSELQSLMRISYAVFCLEHKKQ